jgi:hypothetical protein
MHAASSFFNVAAALRTPSKRMLADFIGGSCYQRCRLLCIGVLAVFTQETGM